MIYSFLNFVQFHVKIRFASMPNNQLKLYKLSIQECIDKTIIKAKNSKLKFSHFEVRFSSVLLNNDIHIPILKLSTNCADAILNDFQNRVHENKIIGGLLIDEPLNVTITGIDKSNVNRKLQYIR